MNKRSLRVDGLHDDVEIIRDHDAVPHVYAHNKLDVFFGLGYVHAQDRLWQMEANRRLAQGRLSEVFGKRTVKLDTYMRVLGIHRVASHNWKTISSETQAIVTAYVSGINALITQQSFRRSPEFFLTRTKPEVWSEIDILASMKLMSFALSGNLDIELLYNEVVAKIGREQASKCFPVYPASGPLIAPQMDIPAQATVAEPSVAGHALKDSGQLGALHAEVREMLGKEMHYPGDLGSNSWVVDGRKSATGKPLLASDPHLGITAPSLWYLAHLHAGDFTAAGATIPGLPGVVIGRNEYISWGMSNLNSDVEDLYYEQIDSEGQQVLFEGQWETIQVHTEVIRVKGQAAHTCQVRSTRHGPLLSDALESLPEAGLPLALAWTALQEEDTTVTAFLKLNEARTWADFTDALAYHVSPPLNFIYADVDGNIGYQAAGLMPVKTAYADPLPREGWSGKDEWHGWVPFHALPRAFNPPEHFIVSANQKPYPANYPYFMGNEWASTYRAQRIRDVLETQQTFTLADFAQLQGDTLSLFARDILPVLQTLVRPQSQFEELALGLLRDWDYDMRGESAAAALCGVWLRLLRRRISEELVTSELAARYEWRFQYTGRVLSSIYLTDEADLFSAEQRALFAQETFSQAIAYIKKQAGQDLTRWRWDRLHRLQVIHSLFGQVPLLKHFFSRSVPAPGDWSTVNFGPIDADFQQYAGAGYRQLIDMASLENGLFLHVLGQSGHIFSPHYADYLADWRALRYRSLRFTRKAVEQSRRSTLYLTAGK